MGKYMKKGKITGDIAVMEIPQSSSLGVRTRARTLALQPNNNNNNNNNNNINDNNNDDNNSEFCYLQLRSRRLEKLPPSSRVRVSSVKRGSDSKKSEGYFGSFGGKDNFFDEASCGENNLEFDSRERSTRESTPCSLSRCTESIGTPGSTTRPTSANRRVLNTQRAIPTTPEMEEFFAGFELHQQQQFIDKYNYDIMNDLPLPGRYEWVRVDN